MKNIYGRECNSKEEIITALGDDYMNYLEEKTTEEVNEIADAGVFTAMQVKIEKIAEKKRLVNQQYIDEAITGDQRDEKLCSLKEQLFAMIGGNL